MATKFYNVEKAAEVLGVSAAEVNQMRERLELHGYRDGSDWKFKAEEVDQLAQQGGASGGLTSDEDEVAEFEIGDVDLVMDDDLLESGSGGSGTVVASEPVEMDGIDLDAGLVELGDDDLVEADDSQSELSLDLGDESGLDLDISSGTGSSLLQMADDDLDDDDLVIGGMSGIGSDLGGSSSKLTLGGDSGISLVDPTDSGLSLEEPLNLSDDDVDEEDSLLALAEGSVLGAEAGGSDDFLLSAADDDEIEDGSDVIVLEEDEDAMPGSGGSGVSDLGLGSSEIGLAGSELGLGSSEIGLAGSGLAGSGLAGSSSVAGSEVGSQLGGSELGLGSEVGLEGSQLGMSSELGIGSSQLGMGSQAGMGDSQPGLSGVGMFESADGFGEAVGQAEGPAAFGQEGMADPQVAVGAGASAEVPFGKGWIFFLGLTNVSLCLVLMLMYDLARNMWSWNQAFGVNSWLMDLILGR